jgi:hypothetical protein
LLADSGVSLAKLPQTNRDTESVTNWLGQLVLLRNLPFVHLVPDARMLPPESIRFFYLDPNWLGALLDGALSIGLRTSRESAVQAALTQQLKQMAHDSAHAWRANGQTPAPAASGPTAGFLLRSALVSGWPGLQVNATGAGTPMPLLRLEHLGPDVLIALFNGVPDKVVLGEPREGLGFGVNDEGKVATRKINAGTVVNGSSVDVFNPASPTQTTVAVRAGGQRVLNISADPLSQQPSNLLELLAQGIADAPANIGPACFAVQMVKGPEELCFSLNHNRPDVIP